MTPSELEQYLKLMTQYKVTNLKLKDLDISIQPSPAPTINLPSNPEEEEAQGMLDALVQDLRVTPKK